MSSWKTQAIRLYYRFFNRQIVHQKLKLVDHAEKRS